MCSYTTISVLTNATLVGVPGASPTNTTHLIRHEKTQTKRQNATDSRVDLSSSPIVSKGNTKEFLRHTHKVLKKEKKRDNMAGLSTSFTLHLSQKALKSLKI